MFFCISSAALLCPTHAPIPHHTTPSSVINALPLSLVNCVRQPGKSMQTNGLNSDASKSDREKLNRMLEEMFEESDMWLVSE
ncbi:DinI-like family protein [Leclercia adecarboxylata]|uniref:DinI-like family protein n=1 Tax=Leclercia adecarboxylata TaxID=83655 RepID=UPI003D815B4E